MTDQTSQPAGAAGWYPDPDPSGPGRLRWWDGTAWTDRTQMPGPAPAGGPAATQAPPPPPPAKGGHRARWWLIGGAAAVVLLVVVVTAGVLLTRGKGYPSKWDPRVADLVAFDQKERGLDYKHPVEVVFVPEDEFTDSVKIDTTQLDEQDLKDVSASAAQLRAFGLIDGSVDLVGSTNDIQGAGVLAYYSPKQKKVYVRGTEVTPAVKATLAHELVHVLQDQHFDLDQMLKDAPDPGAVRALVEGDASRVEQAYVKQLPQADQDAITAEQTSTVKSSGLDTMPDALVAATTAPYALGAPAVGVLVARGGNSDVNQAFLRPPTADAQILDPRRIGDPAPKPVALPDAPAGANVVSDASTNGALFWDIVLARRVGLHPALAFADSWAGDSSMAYEKDGRTCTVSAIRAGDAAGATSMLSLLQQWLAGGTQPLDEQTYTKAGSEANTVVLGVCDPGTDSVAPGAENSQAAIALASVRLEVERQALTAKVTMPVARCLANGAISELDTTDLGADADPAVVQAKVVEGGSQALLSCN